MLERVKRDAPIVALQQAKNGCASKGNLAKD
jgi:hypothetical protein